MGGEQQVLDLGDDFATTDRTAELAATLGVPVEEFAAAFGARWRVSLSPPDHDFDADPSGGLGFPVTPWHLGGDPVQLMVRVFSHGLYVARPEGRWAAGTHDLVHDPHDQEYVAAGEIGSDHTEEVVRRILRRRRTTFRYCRYCLEPHGPEYRVGDTCMACATAWQGMVY